MAQHEVTSNGPVQRFIGVAWKPETVHRTTDRRNTLCGVNFDGEYLIPAYNAAECADCNTIEMRARMNGLTADWVREPVTCESCGVVADPMQSEHGGDMCETCVDEGDDTSVFATPNQGFSDAYIRAVTGR